jgi:hypothetical protein
MHSPAAERRGRAAGSMLRATSIIHSPKFWLQVLPPTSWFRLTGGSDREQRALVRFDRAVISTGEDR